MAYFTSGNTYTFTAPTNSSNNQCVIYEMFKPYEIPATAYSFTAVFYINGPVYLHLNEVGPDDEGLPPGQSNLSILPYDIAMQYTDTSVLDTNYYSKSFITGNTQNIFAVESCTTVYSTDETNFSNRSTGNVPILARNTLNTAGVILTSNGLSNETWERTDSALNTFKIPYPIGTVPTAKKIWEIRASGVSDYVGFTRTVNLLMRQSSTITDFDTANVIKGPSMNFTAPTNTFCFTIEVDTVLNRPLVHAKGAKELIDLREVDRTETMSSTGLKTITTKYYIDETVFGAGYIG